MLHGRFTIEEGPFVEQLKKLALKQAEFNVPTNPADLPRERESDRDAQVERYANCYVEQVASYIFNLTFADDEETPEAFANEVAADPLSCIPNSIPGSILKKGDS